LTGRSRGCVNDVRCIGGMNLGQALLWNCGNQCIDVKGDIQIVEAIRVRVPKRCAGAEQLVVVMKYV
jgi:hypothetical protein